MKLAPDTPISGLELPALFAPLARFPIIALAVSGGPDSLALLHLFAHWRTLSAPAQPGLVLTVDHGLRPQSATEATFVAREARALGLPHETLLWNGPKPATGLSNAAREARYRLLCERLAREPESPRALITAHTQDDQGETVLMRLARGSGVDGLAGIRPERLLLPEHAITLLRPLLTIPKSRLEATLSALGKTWITDPTNADPRFERPRLRQSAALRESAGLTNAAIALSAQRLARANDALIAATDALERAAVRHDPGISATIERAAWMAAALELRIRLLDRLLRACGGSHPPPQLSEVERLAGRLLTATTPTTLGGCLILPDNDTITLTREPGRPGRQATRDRP